MKKLVLFILSIVILLLIGLTYNHLNTNDKRAEIKSISNIEIYKFNSYTKFSNEKIDVIDTSEKLSKFKIIINSLDNSEGIKRIDPPENINVESFKYSAHIKPNFKFMGTEATESESYLLYIYVEDSEGKSYITFSGTGLSYVLDENNTKILEEIFSDVK